MSARDGARPGSYSWIARVYAKSDHGNDELVGCGVVIDDQRILTCAHVVGRFEEGRGWAADAEVRLAFPMSDEGDPGELLPAQGVVFPDSDKREDDVAVLYLAGPLPAGVKAAPLRCPESGSLASGRWRVLGFPEDLVGESASGTVEELARGWIRLNKESGDRLRLGFSGSGVWSAEYEAVVAVVTQAGGGDGRALTLRRAVECLPGENLGDLAWWSLAHDREAKEHWELRARGVSRGSHRRPRFQGRKAALLKIKRWLDRDQASRRVLVVTGAPGAGKSAVLARVVTTADLSRRVVLPASDDGIRATAGSVGCAIHARGKTALEVAAEVARAASAALPNRLEGFDDEIFRALAERRISDDGSSLRPRRFNVIIDALDEAVSPEQARVIIREVILPMVGRCADAGAQVIVGARRTDAEGYLLEAFGSSAELVDLDSEEFFAREDLTAYVLATLQMADREEASSPYADDAVARPVADRIAELSDGNFLVAGLTAQTHGTFDTVPVDPAALSFIPEVTSVMREYLRHIPEIAGMPRPAEMLTALAFAEAPGFPASLWRLALQTLVGDDVPEMRLAWFARSRAASFLVESSEESGQNSAFRLFHPALNDALLTAVRPGTATQAEQALTHAFLKAGRSMGWEHAPVYLLRSLPAHASRVRLVDDLLADDAYLLHADLRRVLQVTGRAVSSTGQDRARLVGLTPEATTVGTPSGRAAVFSVTEALDGLGTAYRENPQPAPYRAQWAVATPSYENLTLRGSDLGGVNGVCAVQVEDRTLLAAAFGDGVVRLWNPADGSQVRILEGHKYGTYAVCAVQAGNRTLLAVATGDRTVQLWDPVSGSPGHVLKGHQRTIYAVCAVQAEDRPLLAVASDRTVQLWDPVSGSPGHVLKGHQDMVYAACFVPAKSRTLLATASQDRTVRLWNPADGSHVRTLKGHQDTVYALCAVEARSGTLLATASKDRTVRLWNPVDGSHVRTLEGHQDTVYAVCAVQAGDRTLLATGSSDATVRLWDPADGSQVRIVEGHRVTMRSLCAVPAGERTLLATGWDHTVRLWDPTSRPSDSNAHAHRDWVLAVSAVSARNRTLLATASRDRTVRLWNPADGSHVRTLEGHQDTVNAVCAVPARNRTLLATASSDRTVRLWNPAHSYRSQVRILEGHRNRVNAVCAVPIRNRPLLATGSDDGTVRLWDPANGSCLHVLGHRDYVKAVCAVPIRNRTLLATASSDATVRLWDLTSGSCLHVLKGHRGGAHGVCTVLVGDRTLLATASSDETVRLWDAVDGRCAVTVPTHHMAFAVTAVADSLTIGHAAGVLNIKLEADALA